MTDNTWSTFFATRIQHLISAFQPPDKVGGITRELILQMFNNWPRTSLPVGDRGRAVSRTGINDTKFLTMILVTDEGLQLVSTCRGTVAHSLGVSRPTWTQGHKTGGHRDSITFWIHKTTTRWSLILLSTKLSFHRHRFQASQLLPSYKVPNQGWKRYYHLGFFSPFQTCRSIA